MSWGEREEEGKKEGREKGSKGRRERRAQSSGVKHGYLFVTCSG